MPSLLLSDLFYLKEVHIEMSSPRPEAARTGTSMSLDWLLKTYTHTSGTRSMTKVKGASVAHVIAKHVLIAVYFFSLRWKDFIRLYFHSFIDVSFSGIYWRLYIRAV